MPLFPPVLLHAQDLDHADENVNEVELKRDRLIDGVLGDQATLSRACMVQHLLHIILNISQHLSLLQFRQRVTNERKASKDCQASI